MTRRVLIAVAIIVYLASSATPRPARTTAPVPSRDLSVAPGLSAELTGAPLVVPPQPEVAAQGGAPHLIAGTASHVGTQFGRHYLALPEHRWGRPGIRVTICGVACVTRTSTDAGPDLAMQRAGRVADLNWYDFAIACGVEAGEPDPGLCAVTVAYLGPQMTLPPTDVAP